MKAIDAIGMSQSQLEKMLVLRWRRGGDCKQGVLAVAAAKKQKKK